MSVATLVQVYDEVRRLAIAGSSVAPGDFRLKKLIPPLEQAGAKAPVFARAAQAVQAVVDSTDKSAANAILELATLVNAVLYTQGETGIDGPVEPIPATDLGIRSTQTSARVIKPLIEALSSTGSGRIEIVRDAIASNQFRDLRLIKPAVHAIDDPYPEVADQIVKHVLPLYGQAILPDLRTSFDHKSKTHGHQLRLKLMHALDPAGTREIVQKTLAEGSKELKVVAIECLGGSDADIGFLLEQSKAKAKDVRTAALKAMLRMPTKPDPVMECLLRSIDSSDVASIAAEVARTETTRIVARVCDTISSSVASLLKEKDAKKRGSLIERLLHLVMCLDRRTDSVAEATLLALFDKRKHLATIKSTPGGADVSEMVAVRMSRSTPALQDRLVEVADELTGQSFAAAVYAARTRMTPAAFFDRFSPLLLAAKSKKRGGDADRSESVAQAVAGTASWRYYGYAASFDIDDEDEVDATDPEPKSKLDPRWLDAAIAVDNADLVCSIARAGHPGVVKYLSEKIDSTKRPYDNYRVLDTMARIEHPGLADFVIDGINKSAKATYSYEWYVYARVIPKLPKEQAPRFEALLTSLPEKAVDHLLEPIMSLKNKTE